MYFTEFTHSRLDHSLTVALITEEILRQNGFSQDQINRGIVASLLHDIATPAYGDATKQVDIKNLHEEDHWWNVLDNNAKNFIKQFGTKEEIHEIIKNRGILGKVLDISDRITYTMKDMSAVQIAPVPDDPYLADLNKIIVNNRKIGNIYKDVGIDQKKKEVFFNDSNNLNVFLTLRAHLHQNLYLYPTNQARDLFVAKAIEKIYSNDGSAILFPDKLREMTDNGLMKVLASYYGENIFTMYPQLVNWYPEFEKFDSIDKARMKKNELKQKKNIAVIGIRECKGFDPGTDYKVTNGYNYIKYKNYDPSKANKIEEIAKSTKGIFLYWTDISENYPINRLFRRVL
jgi:HD superfamily phosphohydrolase